MHDISDSTLKALEDQRDSTPTEGEFSQVPGLAIFKRLAKRDDSALVDLFNEFGGALYSLAIRMLGDACEAEEVLQDYLVVAWRRARGYDESRSKPFTYSVSVVRKLCIDRLRRRHAAKRSAKIVPIDSAFVEPDSGVDVVSTVSLHERRRRICEALTALPPAERACVEMAVFGELTHCEIAERASEPLGTVKSRIRRGMVKLRTLLIKANDDR